MALVGGGVVTEKQRKRWQKLYPERSPPPAEIEAFCLDLHELTEADLSAQGREFLSSWPDSRPPCLERGDCGDLPLERLSSAAARELCSHQGKRLPTLVEWLWAAGGGAEDRKYPWGNARPSVKRLNGCDFACARNQQSDCDEHDIKTGSCVMREMADVQGEDGFEERAPVGSFPAGAGRWGHLDLVGNMSEFVVDRDHVLDCGSNYYGEEMSLHSEACHRAPYVDSQFMGARCARAAEVTRRP